MSAAVSSSSACDQVKTCCHALGRLWPNKKGRIGAHIISATKWSGETPVSFRPSGSIPIVVVQSPSYENIIVNGGHSLMVQDETTKQQYAATMGEVECATSTYISSSSSARLVDNMENCNTLTPTQDHITAETIANRITTFPHLLIWLFGLVYFWLSRLVMDVVGK